MLILIIVLVEDDIQRTPIISGIFNIDEYHAKTDTNHQTERKPRGQREELYKTNVTEDKNAKKHIQNIAN